MELLATFAILSVLCSLGRVDANPESVVHRYGHSHVMKRFISIDQLPLQDIIDCTALILDYQCSPTGYVRELIDIALECESDSTASELSAICATSGSGDRCGVAVLSLDFNGAASCIGAVAADACPSACSTFLETARTDLGCCVNTYLNRTDVPIDSSIFAVVEQALDYRLWDLCGVDLPPSACEDVLPLNPPANAQTCTVEELFTRIAEYECVASVGQPFVDAILQEEKCYPFARQLVESCGRNSDDRFCVSLLGDDLVASLSTDPTLVSLAACGASSTCDASCQSAVADASQRLGCCVNIYNSSDPNIQLSTTSLSYEYWRACGVDTPGFCTSALSSAAAMKSFAWLVAAVMASAYVLG